MLTNYVFLILTFVFVAITILAIIIDRYLEKQQIIKFKNRQKNSELERNKDDEKEKMLWFIFADFIINEEFYNKIMSNYEYLLKTNNTKYETTYFYSRNEHKILLRGKFRIDAKKSILNFHNIKNVGIINVMTPEEYNELENDFMIYFFEVAKLSELTDLNFLKDKIVDYQPERRNELEHFIKKIKLKNMFIVD